jgi:hypothetical protein
LSGSLDKSFNEGIRNPAKNRANHFFEKLTGEFVIKSEFDFTGMITQRGEMPLTIKAPERAINQLHGHARWQFFIIFCREMGFDTQKINMQGSYRFMVITEPEFGFGTPGQELGVGFDIINQRKHLRGRMFDKNRFLNKRHSNDK